MSDPLQAALHAAFPDRPVESVEERDTRPGNRTARVAFADGDVVYLKTATDGTRRLVREAAATRCADARCPIETPAVVAADPDGDPPYLAMEPIPGIPLQDPWSSADTAERARLLREVGETVAAVHEAAFEQPGRILGGDEGGLDLAAESWSETLAADVEERTEDLFAARFRELPGRLAAVLRDAAPLLDDAPAALLHCDLNRSNCRLDPRGLLDWERALVGDPGLDLADAESHLVELPDADEAERSVLRNGLREGYRAYADALPDGFEHREPVYRAVAFLLTPQTFELWAPAADQPTEELADWVRGEFDERLDAAREAAHSA
ncbi:phosphotransferase family protein [Halobacterium wangiae]|uniref:phosphotransferase family protein n=1 Tax=Halobacterium wangiae TaxID=2902623 RepID=UPI001E57B2B1|nr:phosphotransferase [Halobacterium wangiae]